LPLTKTASQETGSQAHHNPLSMGKKG